MSGFEIVGVVLGGIPIVLEAYNRYQTVSKTFSGFRQHSRALSRLDTILNAQKTIFRGDVTKLLTAVTNDAEKARNFISGERSWDDLGIHGLDLKRAESLRDSFASWKATLDEIHDSLQAICFEIESFRVSASTMSTQLGLSVERFRKQFKLCVKNESVQEAIEDLRSFTTDFNRITSQIIDELKDPSLGSSSSDKPAACTKPSYWNSLEMYRQVRSASSSLYETLALRWSCALHQRHVASITFQDGNKPPQSGKGIKFEAVVTPSESETSPLWLEIECFHDTRTSQPSSGLPSVVKSEFNKTWLNVVDTLEKHSQPVSLDSTQRMPNKIKGQTIPLNRIKTTKVVRFQALSLKPNQVQGPNKGQEQDTTHQGDTQLTNLEVIDDICQHLQTSHSTCEPTYVGYIEHSGLYRFYMPSSQRFPTSSQMSLAEIISWVAEDEVSRNLPRSAMAQIASSLACAVLQYHSTPWLPEMWQSSHVRFFGIKDWLKDSTNLSLTSPHFKVEFSKADVKGKGKAMDLSLPPISRYRQAVRNEVLFSFGLVLLELGYSKPWHLLRLSILKNLPLKKQVDYHAAETLAQSPMLRNRMGPRYSTIVRKCLGCDFGLGENSLENEELQGIFLIDVVNTLQEAVRGLKELERKLYLL